MKAAFVLVAAGAGRRLGSPLPKAFIDLEGKTLLVRSLEALQLEGRFSAAAVVVPDALLDETNRLVEGVARLGLRATIVAGGVERQDSVRAGLRALPHDCTVIVVHDAARPFVAAAMVAACIDAALEHGAATVAVPATDTIKEVDDSGRVLRTLDRARLRLVQTPQAFRAEVLLAAHERAEREGVEATDDAALIEAFGGIVWSVPGDPGNIKITTPEDLAWARWRLAAAPR